MQRQKNKNKQKTKTSKTKQQKTTTQKKNSNTESIIKKCAHRVTNTAFLSSTRRVTHGQD
jgi:hypothetical protein